MWTWMSRSVRRLRSTGPSCVPRRFGWARARFRPCAGRPAATRLERTTRGPGSVEHPRARTDMSRTVRPRAVLALISLQLASPARLLSGSRADEPDGRDIPPAFAPFEYLLGRWNGQAMPKDSAQSFRGWPETQSWAWIFTKGKPIGL